jgi:hypothetical protein
MAADERHKTIPFSSSETRSRRSRVGPGRPCGPLSGESLPYLKLQDRLVHELRVAGIATLEAANRYLADLFLPAYHATFARAPWDPVSVVVPARAEAKRDCEKKKGAARECKRRPDLHQQHAYATGSGSGKCPLDTEDRLPSLWRHSLVGRHRVQWRASPSPSPGPRTGTFPVTRAPPRWGGRSQAHMAHCTGLQPSSRERTTPALSRVCRSSP